MNTDVLIQDLALHKIMLNEYRAKYMKYLKFMAATLTFLLLVTAATGIWGIIKLHQYPLNYLQIPPKPTPQTSPERGMWVMQYNV